jgi:hypothetical protein
MPGSVKALPDAGSPRSPAARVDGFKGDGNGFSARDGLLATSSAKAEEENPKNARTS